MGILPPELLLLVVILVNASTNSLNLSLNDIVDRFNNGGDEFSLGF